MSDTKHVFRCEPAGNVIVVVPAGEHVGFEMMQIQKDAERIIQKIEAGEGPHVVVDAGETAYFSSSVIGGLIRIWEAAQRKGGKLVLCNMSDDALSAVVATRLDTRWHAYDSREAALEALGA